MKKILISKIAMVFVLVTALLGGSLRDAASIGIIGAADGPVSAVTAYTVQEEAASPEPAAEIDDTVKIMGQGMLGIFIVMVLLYAVIEILNKTTKGKE